MIVPLWMGTEAQVGKAYPSVQGTISQDDTWSSGRHAIGDIIIPDGVTLTIKSVVQFDENCGITVEIGGRLVLDGCRLTHYLQNKLWKGVRLEGDPLKEQLWQFQGNVDLKNEAIIEHSICAINIPFYYGGGIIQANNSTFRNNINSVYYREYIYVMNGKIIDNKSFFNKCTFTIDQNNIFEYSNLTPGNHVNLYGVTGVTFKGCTFDCLYGFNINGIEASESGFKVREFCNDIYAPIFVDCPCENKIPSSFNNLNYGILSNNSNSLGIVIDQNIFGYNNVRSIVMNTSNKYIITRNDVGFKTFGLTSDYSTGYRVEENTFDGGSSINSAGLLIRNSNNNNNEIYNNNFYNINGNGAIWLIDNNGQNLIGLQIICNKFQGNIFDIFISNNSTIRTYQGDIFEGADNVFINTNQESFIDFSSQNKVYFHSDGINYYPKPPTPPTFPSYPFSDKVTPNSCSSSFCFDGTGHDTIIIRNIGYYSELENEYNNLLNELDKNGYGYVLDNLESGEFSQEIILEAYTFISKISRISELMRKVSDGTISSIIQDSIVDLNLLKMWYEILHTQIAKYSLVEAHLLTKDYEMADAVLFQMNDLFEFNEKEISEYNNYKRYYFLKKQIKLSGKNWQEMNEEEILLLHSIADANTGRSSSIARGILCFFFNICVEIDFDMENIEEPVLSPKLTNYNKELISCKSVNFDDAIKIEVYNMMGSLVLVENEKRKFDSINLTSGIYIIRIYTKNSQVSSYKFFKN